VKLCGNPRNLCIYIVKDSKNCDKTGAGTLAAWFRNFGHQNYVIEIHRKKADPKL
jgi:hypothetical protein